MRSLYFLRLESSRAISLAFAALLLGPAPGAARAAPNEIVLGASVQLTGPVASTGRYYRDAYEMAVEKINGDGGVKVDGKAYKLALKVYDNQSDVGLSVRQYTQLAAQDKVDFLLGPFASNFAIADSAISEKYQIPMVQGGGASDPIFERNFKYIFGTLAPASGYFDSTIAMLKHVKPEPRSVALLYADDSFDAAAAKGARARLESAGLNTVMDERYDATAGNFETLLPRIGNRNVDAVLVAGHEREILNFIRQAKRLNVSPRMYSFTVGVPSADFRHTLGKNADYAFGMTAWLPSRALKDRWFGSAEQFAKDYEVKYGYEPDYHAASAVADVETIVMAIEKAGSLDPKKVRDAIAASDFDSLYGKIAFGRNGQIAMDQTVIQIQNGDVVPVYDGRKFLMPAKYPMPAWSKR